VSQDPEATQTFTPTGPQEAAGGKGVELFDPGSIEERLLGQTRPATFERHFPFHGRVGEGGMGEVYLASDAILARDVAIKVLRKKLRTNPRIVRRFLREAQVTAQLEHPNVVPFHSLESTGDGSPAFVMKLIEGETFKLQASVGHAQVGAQRVRREGACRVVPQGLRRPRLQPQPWRDPPRQQALKRDAR